MPKKISHYRENPKGRDHQEPVTREMARLKGTSEKALEADDRRGASSPLGQPRGKGRKR